MLENSDYAYDEHLFFYYLDQKRIENVFYILDLSTFARRSNNNSVQVFDQKMLIKQLKPVLIKIVFHEHLCAHWFLIFFFHFYRFRLLGKRLSFFRRGVFLFLLFFRWSWLFAYAIPREKVRTTNFTTSKTKKNIKKVGDNHYIENGFWVAFELITTTTSQRWKWLLSWSLHRKEWKEHWKDQFCLNFTFW
jgi:hypothetical protein